VCNSWTETGKGFARACNKPGDKQMDGEESGPKLPSTRANNYLSADWRVIDQCEELLTKAQTVACRICRNARDLIAPYAVVTVPPTTAPATAPLPALSSVLAADVVVSST
jgi:hypothetical protein